MVKRKIELGEREAELIRDARDALRATENVDPRAMSELFYLVQYDNLRFALADLLDLLDDEPAQSSQRASA